MGEIWLKGWSWGHAGVTWEQPGRDQGHLSTQTRTQGQGWGYGVIWDMAWTWQDTLQGRYRGGGDILGGTEVTMNTLRRARVTRGHSGVTGVHARRTQGNKWTH